MTSNIQTFRLKRSASKAAAEFVSTSSVVVDERKDIDEVELSIVTAVKNTNQKLYKFFDEESFSSLEIFCITPTTDDNPIVMVQFIIYFKPIDGALALKWGPVMKRETEEVIAYTYESRLSWVDHAKVFVVNYNFSNGEVSFDSIANIYGPYSKYHDWKEGMDLGIQDLIRDANGHLYQAFYWANILKSSSFGALISEPKIIGINENFENKTNEILGSIIILMIYLHFISRTSRNQFNAT